VRDETREKDKTVFRINERTKKVQCSLPGEISRVDREPWTQKGTYLSSCTICRVYGPKSGVTGKKEAEMGVAGTDWVQIKKVWDTMVGYAKVPSFVLEKCGTERRTPFPDDCVKKKHDNRSRGGPMDLSRGCPSTN